MRYLLETETLQSGMLTSSNADPAFTKNGFFNWKIAMDKKKAFQKHESSDSHMEAVVRYVTAPATVIGDIGDLLSERHALEKSKNRKILLSTQSNIRYLARQALLLRGDWNTETMSKARPMIPFVTIIALNTFSCCLSRTNCLRWIVADRFDFDSLFALKEICLVW